MRKNLICEYFTCNFSSVGLLLREKKSNYTFTLRILYCQEVIDMFECLTKINWKKVGLFASGTLFGTAGIKALASDDAKKLYTNCTAAVLRAKETVMNTVTTVQENAEDIYEGAKQINEERAEAKAAAEFAEEAEEETEETEKETTEEVEAEAVEEAAE